MPKSTETSLELPKIARLLLVKNLYKKGLWLEYFTVGYNALEAILSLTFGSLSNSIALIGFGLDSIVESLSGLVLIWRLQQHRHLDQEAEEKIERQATKLVAITFWVLGVYILFESGKKRRCSNQGYTFGKNYPIY